MPCKPSISDILDTEYVFRRIHKEAYNNDDAGAPIAWTAFKPSRADIDGISVFREDCGVTAEQVAKLKNKTCYIAKLLVSDIHQIRIEGNEDVRLRLKSTPKDNDILPGHASLPQLTIQIYQASKSDCFEICTKLAELANKGEILKQICSEIVAT